MQINITSNMDDFIRMLRQTPDAISDGAKTALTDIKNDWKAEAVDSAPIDTGNLRRQIDAKVFNPGTDGHIEIQANAMRGKFNYAYYIHEGPGHAVSGEKKFLDKPAQDNTDKWLQWLEDEVKAELRGKGW